jgi:iron complex outermembrane receptor protein
LNTRGIGAEAETDWAEKQGLWAFRTGAKLQHEGVDHTLTGEHDRQKAGLHGQFDRNFDPFSISLGARGDWTSDFGLFPSANLLAAYEWTPKSIVKAGVGYTVNIPTFGQLYQPSHGSIDQVRGNPDLKEEKVVNASLGLTQKVGDVGELTVTLFRQDVTDLIAYEEGQDDIKRPENIPNAWRQGMEATFKWRITPQTDLDFSYIWQKSRNETNGRKLTYTPAHKLKTVLKQTFETTDTRLEVSLTADSEQYSDLVNSEEKKVDGYMSVDLKVVQPFKCRGLPLELFLQIHNLFDKDYDVHYGYPDDGFRAYAGLNIEF